MDIISVIIVLCVVGVLLWALSLFPLDPIIRKIIYAIVVVAVVLWLFRVSGLLPPLHQLHL